MPEANPPTIVLYDGVCGLCNGLVQFLLKRDLDDRFQFASLQSDAAAQLLRRHGINAADLDTVYVVIDSGERSERLLSRSDAIIHVLQRLGGIWSLMAAGKILPRPVRDSFYKFVATNRYRVFGKYEVCLMPEERFKHKFVD